MIETAERYKDTLIRHRRDLHRIPELNRTLPETNAYLRSCLEKLDCRLTFLCESGICAFFDKGKKDTYGFRGDMDGLPVTEVTGAPYASQHEGRMHACGHDAHMAMVLTFGEYIDTVDDIDHNVLLIFQPAEEMMGGAEDICKSGIFEKYNVTRIFGMHMWPFIEKGKISSRPGAFMPKSAEIHVDFYGKTAHGTAPYEGKDTIFIGTEFVQHLYREHAKWPGAIRHFKEGMGDIDYTDCEDPEDKTLIHIGKFESGHARNIVSDHAHLMGTVRGYDEEKYQKVLALIERCMNDMCRKYECRAEFWHSGGYPPVRNNVDLYGKLGPVFDDLGDIYEEMELPLVISEDFSFYGLYVPSVFFVLGTGTGIPLHSSRFDFDDSLLVNGLKLYMSLIRH